jgi:hypothetical protein
MRRTSFLAMALLALAPLSALAHGDRDSSSGIGGSLAGGLGGFGTVGESVSQTAGWGRAESYADGTAGVRLQWGPNGFQADGFQTNETGSMTEGNAFGRGFSTGFAHGGAAGLAGSVNRWRNR